MIAVVTVHLEAKDVVEMGGGNRINRARSVCSAVRAIIPSGTGELRRPGGRRQTSRESAKTASRASLLSHSPSSLNGSRAYDPPSSDRVRPAVSDLTDPLALVVEIDDLGGRTDRDDSAILEQDGPVAVITNSGRTV